MGNATLLLALGFLVLYVVIWAICLIGWRTAYLRYSGKSIPSSLVTRPSGAVPGVTIIRPICGLDDNLYNALESSMNLDYPTYEIIFALQDQDDEAIPVVKMLMEKHPQVEAKIVIGESTGKSTLTVDDRQVGVNPKINNLMAPFEQARYDLLWVIDSTIYVQPQVLGHTVEAFVGNTHDEEATLSKGPPERGEVGLVHHVPLAVVYQRTWGSLIEQAFLNTTHAKMYLAINTLAVDSCVMGKSNMYSKSNIARLTTPSPTLRQLPNPSTGLAGFGPFLAEDNMIALSIWHELGLKHAMSPDVAFDFLGALSVRDYIMRRVRWIRVRKKMTPLIAVILEPFTESIVCGIYGSWAFSRVFGATATSLFVVHMVLWLLVDLSVRHSLETNSSGPPASTVVFVIAWMAREVMALPIWLYGITSSTVTWRGKSYEILASGEARRL